MSPNPSPVINKADREEADSTFRDIQYMLSLGIGEKDWEPETFRTIALNGEGVGEFVEALERHRRYLLGIASKGLI